MNIGIFFPPHTKILALPNLKHPKLFLGGTTIQQRWAESSLYPAYRFSARMYRVFLRIKAGLGIGDIFINSSSENLLKKFLSDTQLHLQSVILLMGTSGPTQKYILQLRNNDGIAGYIKYAEKPRAINLLHREFTMLSVLPRGSGPEVKHFGRLGEGVGMLISPVSGTPFRAVLPPPEELMAFSERFQTFPYTRLQNHPWIKRHWLTYEKFHFTGLSNLSHREWPVGYYHGDFAPWNLFMTTTGGPIAIDWEYGAKEGFPYLDLIQYILKTAGLIYRWTPENAQKYSVNYLLQHVRPPLDPLEAQSLVRLAAFHAFLQEKENGFPPTSPGQTWKRAIWETSPGTA